MKLICKSNIKCEYYDVTKTLENCKEDHLLFES